MKILRRRAVSKEKGKQKRGTGIKKVEVFGEGKKGRRRKGKGIRHLGEEL